MLSCVTFRAVYVVFLVFLCACYPWRYGRIEAEEVETEGMVLVSLEIKVTIYVTHSERSLYTSHISIHSNPQVNGTYGNNEDGLDGSHGMHESYHT